jgi:hypothetical protein
MKVDKKTIIAIVLVVVAVIVVIYQFGGIKSKAPRTTAKTTAGQTAVASKAGAAGSQEQAASAAAKDYIELIAGVKESDLDYSGPGFVDPMTPLIGMKGTEKKGPSGPATNVPLAAGMGYKIEGIVWDELSPLALINGQVVGVGEQLEDGTLITEITPNTVRFTIGGRQYFLVFREE